MIRTVSQWLTNEVRLPGNKVLNVFNLFFHLIIRKYAVSESGTKLIAALTFYWSPLIRKSAAVLLSRSWNLPMCRTTTHGGLLLLYGRLDIKSSKSKTVLTLSYIYGGCCFWERAALTQYSTKCVGPSSLTCTHLFEFIIQHLIAMVWWNDVIYTQLVNTVKWNRHCSNSLRAWLTWQLMILPYLEHPISRNTDKHVLGS